MVDVLSSFPLVQEFMCSSSVKIQEFYGWFSRQVHPYPLDATQYPLLPFFPHDLVPDILNLNSTVLFYDYFKNTLFPRHKKWLFLLLMRQLYFVSSSKKKTKSNYFWAWTFWGYFRWIIKKRDAINNEIICQLLICLFFCQWFSKEYRWKIQIKAIFNVIFKFIFKNLLPFSTDLLIKT